MASRVVPRVVPAVVRTELIMASQALMKSSASLSALTLPSCILAFGHRSRAFKLPASPDAAGAKL